ncbi:unnamed protein product [Agarophyton chilense]
MQSSQAHTPQQRSVSIITSLERAAHFFRPRRHKPRRFKSPALTEPVPHPVAPFPQPARTVSSLLSICRELNADGLGVRATASSVHPSTVSPFLQVEHCGPKYILPHATPGIDTPRCGQQCLTFVIQGQLRYRDSCANTVLLNAGSASLLTAGSGLVVSHTLHGPTIEYISIWINIPRHLKAATPRCAYTFNPACVVIGAAEAAAQITVLAAPHRDTITKLNPQSHHSSKNHEYSDSPFQLETYAGNAAVYDVRMHPKSQLVLNPETRRAFVYVYRGSARIGQSNLVKEGQFAVLAEDAHLPIVIRSPGLDVEEPCVPRRDWYDFDSFVEDGCWCIVLAGDPIMEPVSMLSSGIVACTPQEIRKAFQEYRCGSLGSCSPSTVQRTHLHSSLDELYDSDSEHSDTDNYSEFALGKSVA